MRHKINRRESFALMGAGVLAAGVVTSYLRRSIEADRASLRLELDETKRAVAALHGLAANEAAVYLRGYMKGQTDAGGGSDVPGSVA